MKREVKRLRERAFFKLHRLGIRFGFFILPVHHYVQFPNVLELERTRNIWARPSRLTGISIDVEKQIKDLQSICLPFIEEYRDNRTYKEACARFLGPGYGYVEAQALHGVIRHHKPQRIIEVGGGVSTYCMLAALEENRRETGASTRVTCIEPYPSRALKGLTGIDLMAEKVQVIPLGLFAQLGHGDLLFIDSSHTVKTGGDVNYLVLEVLPQLAPGVIVHFHDIPFPYDYQPSILRSFLPWSEGSLLQAYLAHSARTTILFSLSLLNHEAPEALADIFPGYTPQPQGNGLLPDGYRPEKHQDQHFPSSIYLVMN
jgi:predicted O-methyltransferase YrrM